MASGLKLKIKFKKDGTAQITPPDDEREGGGFEEGRERKRQKSGPKSHRAADPDFGAEGPSRKESVQDDVPPTRGGRPQRAKRQSYAELANATFYEEEEPQVPRKSRGKGGKARSQSVSAPGDLSDDVRAAAAGLRERKGGKKSYAEEEVDAYLEGALMEEDAGYEAAGEEAAVPYEENPLANLDRIIDWRVVTDRSDVDGQLGSPRSKKKRKEYLLKWKGLSYLHCSWVSIEEVEAAAQYLLGLRAKLRNFQNKVEYQHRGDLEGDDSQGHGLLRVEWTTVDRIIDSRYNTEGGLEYLVKWKELGYDECTWELEDAIAAFGDSINRYRHFKKRRKRGAEDVLEEGGEKKRKRLQKVGDARKGKGAFEKLEETPAYLAGGQLHEYQLEGLNWLRFAWQQQKHVILADEMGLGKTIQTIAYVASLKEDGASERPHIVVAPLSTLRNWEREFQVWAPQLNVIMYVGSGPARQIIRQHEFYFKESKKHTKQGPGEKKRHVKFDALLTSYETVLADAGILKGIKWDSMVVDEGHRLKSSESKLSKALHDLHTEHRILLTGTPLQNNLDELFMLMHFLDATKFSSLEDFQQEFADIGQEEQVARLHKLLAPHMLRRLKKDVLKAMPPKRELIVRVDLSAHQKKLYKAVLTRNYEVLSGGKGQASLSNVVMELRKVCGHPYLFDGQETYSTDPKEAERLLVEASGKMVLLDKMMPKLKEQGHRVIIFSQFTRVLDLLEDWLNSKGWGYQRIDGSVTGATRQIRIDQFNNPESKQFVFLLSTRAGGLGINLATADTVVIYDSDWNPHNDLQAMARAHRLGQKNEVMIYRLVTRATIEERMMQMTKKKMMLEHLVVGKMTKAQMLNQEELDEIVRYGAKELFADETEEEGSNKARSIVYDDAAVDRLLDRSQALEQEGPSLDEGQDNEYLKAFKVANFAYAEEEAAAEEIQREDERLEAAIEEDKQKGKQLWDELLRSRWEDEYVRQEIEMGKGRRSRKQIRYVEDDLAGMAELSSDEEDNEEPEGPVSSGAAPVERKKKAPLREPSVPAGPPLPPPLLDGEGKSLKVLGFTHKQRTTFVKTLMRYGFSDVSWTEFTTRLPNKPLDLIKEYAALFLSHIIEEEEGASAGSETFKDGVPKEGLRVSDVLTRLAVVQLIADKVKETEDDPNAPLLSLPEEAFQEQGPFVALRRSTTAWKEEHDKKLLKAIIKHGYSQWKEIGFDTEIGLTQTLRDEVAVPVGGVLMIGGVKVLPKGAPQKEGESLPGPVPKSDPEGALESKAELPPLKLANGVVAGVVQNGGVKDERNPDQEGSANGGMENAREENEVPKSEHATAELLHAGNEQMSVGKAEDNGAADKMEIDRPESKALEKPRTEWKDPLEMFETKTPEQTASQTEPHIQRRIVEWLKRRVALLEKALNTSHLIKETGNAFIELPESSSDSEEEEVFNPRAVASSGLGALGLRAKGAQIKTAGADLPGPTFQPISAQEVSVLAPDQNPERLEVINLYNNMCKLLLDTRFDAHEAYQGNKAAGLRLRKATRELDSMGNNIRQALVYKKQREAGEEKGKPKESEKESARPEGEAGTTRGAGMEVDGEETESDTDEEPGTPYRGSTEPGTPNRMLDESERQAVNGSTDMAGRIDTAFGSPIPAPSPAKRVSSERPREDIERQKQDLEELAAKLTEGGSDDDDWVVPDSDDD